MHLFAVLPLLLLGPVTVAQERPTDAGHEMWRAALVLTPHGTELPFGVELVRGDQGWTAFLINPPERIEVPRVEWDGQELVLDIPHYRSRIRATREANGELVGEWSKVRGKDRVTRVPFRARLTQPGDASDNAARFPLRKRAVLPKSVAGRWTVDFADDELPAVAIFEQELGSPIVTGTFLTATGDYRYLAGSIDGNDLRLSCFDGAHAFLFEAELSNESRLEGVFHSGNWYRDTWTAERDPNARLGDAFDQTRWDQRVSLADLAYPDLDGRLRSLADPEFAGKATIIQLFGSWCPNCHDETAYLVELHERYAARGLTILGLAFELTGEVAPDTEQVRIFAERYGIEYPLFLAGTANKADATQAFPAIDRLRSFPTTIFFDANGNVRSVHSGFVGPATGAEHTALRVEFEREIESLLAEPSAGSDETWRLLTTGEWSSLTEFAGATYAFFDNDRGEHYARYTVHGSGLPVLDEGELPVIVNGAAVSIGRQVWRLDESTGVLLDPTRFGGRLFPSGRFTTLADASRETLAAGLRADDAVVRRESLVALTRLERSDGDEEALATLLTPLLDDEFLGVRVAAVWVAAEMRIDSLAETLFAMLEHANAQLRREATRGLLRMSSQDAAMRRRLAAHGPDPDPVVRELVGKALTTEASATR